MGHVGGIEAGGTKFRCLTGSGPDDIGAMIEIPTTRPDETVTAVVNFFRQRQRVESLQAIGIASFGPVDLRHGSPRWGFITTTPKKGWAWFDLAGEIGRRLGLPVAFDTDVNGAALGEHRWGAARGIDHWIYLTIGTGIGGGGLFNGRLGHGLLHPEMGHLLIPHDRDRDPFPGCCPYHGDCLEGLASGPAMADRWGVSPAELPADHPAWALEATYLALGIVNLVSTLSPRLVILGGGVMKHKPLLPMVRERVREFFNGYIALSELNDRIDRYVVEPALGADAGVFGALALALDLVG